MIGASGKLTDRRLALLGGLARTGSILRAARSVGMSYRGAWLAVEAMNSAAPAPLVERRAGGKGGGGTRLTASGKALLAAARADGDGLGASEPCRGYPKVLDRRQKRLEHGFHGRGSAWSLLEIFVFC